MAFPVTLNGRTYTLADFAGQNYVDGMPDAFEDFVTQAGNTYVTTSTTTIALGLGSPTFIVADSGKPYREGTPLRISVQGTPTDYLNAIVTSYSGTSLAVTVVSFNGSGTASAWNINIGGDLSIDGTSPPVPISLGGTGATTQAAAQTALFPGIDDNATVRYVTLDQAVRPLTTTGNYTVRQVSFTTGNPSDWTGGTYTQGSPEEVVITSWIADSDIDALLPGSSSGALIEGGWQSHLVFGIRENDANDGVYIVSGGAGAGTTYADDQTYDKLVASFKADGTSEINGSLTVTGGVSAGSLTLANDSKFIHRNQQSATNTFTVLSGTTRYVRLGTVAPGNARLRITYTGGAGYNSFVADFTTQFKSAAGSNGEDPTAQIQSVYVDSGNTEIRSLYFEYVGTTSAYVWALIVNPGFDQTFTTHIEGQFTDTTTLSWGSPTVNAANFNASAPAVVPAARYRSGKVTIASADSFSTDITESLEVDGNAVVDGRLGLTVGNGDGSGITFGSTTEVAAQTLDYYQEGTWTPELSDADTGGNLATGYSTQRGRYTRIGNVVHCSMELNSIDTTGMTSTSALKLQGLPFVAKGDIINRVNIAFYSFVDLDGSGTSNIYNGLTANLVNSQTYANFSTNDRTGGGIRQILVSDLTSGSAIINGVFTYLTNT